MHRAEKANREDQGGPKECDAAALQESGPLIEVHPCRTYLPLLPANRLRWRMQEIASHERVERKANVMAKSAPGWSGETLARNSCRCSPCVVPDVVPVVCLRPSLSYRQKRAEKERRSAWSTPTPSFLSPPCCPVLLLILRCHCHPFIRPPAAAAAAMARVSRLRPSSTSHSAPSTTSKPHSRRLAGTWTEEEDALLLAQVLQVGDSDWVRVADAFGTGRDKKQCRERWCNHVNPTINHAPFTAEENHFILDYTIRRGRQWAKMSRTEELRNRPDNSIKNHFNTNLASHYMDLCRSLDIPRRQTSDVEEMDAKLYAKIKDGIQAPSFLGTRGIKASRHTPPQSSNLHPIMLSKDPSVLRTSTQHTPIMPTPRKSSSLKRDIDDAACLDTRLYSTSKAPRTEWMAQTSVNAHASCPPFPHPPPPTSPYCGAQDESTNTVQPPSQPASSSLSSPTTGSDPTTPASVKEQSTWFPFVDDRGIPSLPPLTRLRQSQQPQKFEIGLSRWSQVDEHHLSLLSTGSSRHWDDRRRPSSSASLATPTHSQDSTASRSTLW